MISLIVKLFEGIILSYRWNHMLGQVQEPENPANPGDQVKHSPKQSKGLAEVDENQVD